MNADSDYAKVVELLAKQQLAPYVSYVSHDRIDGLAGKSADSTVVVRTRDGKIVSGEQSIDIDVAHSGSSAFKSNPVSRPVFEARCYRAVSEAQTTRNDAPAIAFTLTPSCGRASDYPFTTLYADPSTMRPFEVSGVVAHQGGGDEHVTVSLDQRYADFAGRWMPSQLRIDVAGDGLMFWLQVHVHETYDGYDFREKP